MKTPPSKFTITITERDRLAADRYCNNTGCLIATALQRRRYAVGSVNPNRVLINGVSYGLSHGSYDELHARPTAPYYASEVVGLKITLTKQ